jgi:hypothetical protein
MAITTDIALAAGMAGVYEEPIVETGVYSTIEKVGLVALVVFSVLLSPVAGVMLLLASPIVCCATGYGLNELLGEIGSKVSSLFRRLSATFFATKKSLAPHVTSSVNGLKRAIRKLDEAATGRITSRNAVFGLPEGPLTFENTPARNSPNAEGRVVVQSDFFPGAFITLNEKGLKREERREYGQDLQHGICSGSVAEFAYLVEKTKEHFNGDVKSQMYAVTKEFRNGGGAVATMLQNFDWESEYRVLGLDRTNAEAMMSEGSLSIPVEGWQTLKQNHQLAMVLQELGVGAYQVILPGHAMYYKKIDANHGFFFDPNDGTQEINGHQGGGLEKILGERLEQLIALKDSEKEGSAYLQKRFKEAPCINFNPIRSLSNI